MSRPAAFLSGPVLPVVLRLSVPGVVLVAFQSAVSIADTYFVGRLGTEPLAGLALVFPLVMLLQMTSSGAMGGGISSAIARALGGGKADTARRLAAHALVIAVAMGVSYTALVWLFGPSLYRLLGGRGAALEQALAYSSVLFGGATVVWLANTLSSMLRGTGNMLVPACALSGAALLHVPLSGLLVERYGIAGAAMAYVSGFGAAALVMAALVFRPGSRLRPRAGDWKLESRLFGEILKVGAVSMLNSVQTIVTAMVLTGLVGRYGSEALAGFGVGLRLELLQIPIVFAVGQTLVVLVGTNMGAGQPARAKRIAWTGAGLAAAIGLAIGLVVTLQPSLWIGFFTTDPLVLQTGSTYLRTVGLFYPFFAVGVALYFAAQGAGRVGWNFLAGTGRLAVVVAGGMAVSSPQGIFQVIALSLAAYGLLSALVVARVRWH